MNVRKNTFKFLLIFIPFTGCNYFMWFYEPIRETKKIYSSDGQYSVYSKYKSDPFFTGFIPVLPGQGGVFSHDIVVYVYDEIEQQVIVSGSWSEATYPPIESHINFTIDSVHIGYIDIELPRPIKWMINQKNNTDNTRQVAWLVDLRTEAPEQTSS